MIKEHERVVLTIGVPEERLEPGDVGRVVKGALAAVLLRDGMSRCPIVIRRTQDSRSVSATDLRNIKPIARIRVSIGFPVPSLRLVSATGPERRIPSRPSSSGVCACESPVGRYHDDAPLQPPLADAPGKGRGDSRSRSGVGGGQRVTRVETFWRLAGSLQESGTLSS